MQAWPTSSACRRGLPCAAVALQLKKIIFDFSLHRFAASRYVSQRVAVREDGVPMIAVAANADCTQRHHHFLCWHLLKSSPKCVPNPHSPAMAAKIRVCRWTSWGGGVCTNEMCPRLHPRHHHFLCLHLLKSSPKCVPNPHSPAMAAKIRGCRWTSWGGGVRTNENFPRLHPIDACRAYLHFRHFSHCRTQCDA